MDIQERAFIKNAALRILCALVSDNNGDKRASVSKAIDMAFELNQVIEDRLGKVEDNEESA